MTTRVAIVGGSGYTGGETLRWLAQHPRFEVHQVASRGQAGRAVAEVWPQFEGLFDQRFIEPDPEVLAQSDVVVLCTPHGAAKALVPALEAAGAERIVDLSADHRHSEGWVYGSPEWRGLELASARRVAVPGCFATAIGLAVAPFVARGLVAGPVQVAAATGSTGSGVTPAQGTHHPERFANVKAYKVLDHQHVPEVRAFWKGLGAEPELLFVPWSLPLDRGIFATLFVPLSESVDGAEVLHERYDGEPLIRVRDESPELRFVRGTAFLDLSARTSGQTAVILAAIDNLGRGAAAQAVQCLNLMFDLPAHTGLKALPAVP